MKKLAAVAVGRSPCDEPILAHGAGRRPAEEGQAGDRVALPQALNREGRTHDTAGCRSFDDVRDRKRDNHRGRCPRCGAPGRKAASVRIGLNEHTEGNGNPRAVSTRSVSFCEPCGVEVYEQIHTLLIQAGKQP